MFNNVVFILKPNCTGLRRAAAPGFGSWAFVRTLLYDEPFCCNGVSKNTTYCVQV